MQQITNPTLQRVAIDSDTSDKLMVRIPLIIEKLSKGQSVNSIASDLGIHRSNVYRTLRKVDFGPVIDLCVERAIEQTELIGEPKDRAWSYIQLAKTLHSKKTIGELTTTHHTINEERRTARLELDRLTPEDQRHMIRIQKIMQIEPEPTKTVQAHQTT